MRQSPIWLTAIEKLSDKGPAFSESYLIARAAVAGQGLALVRNIYVDDDLRSQRLVKALTVNWLCNSRIMRSRQLRPCRSPRFDGFAIGWSKRRDRKSNAHMKRDR